MLQVLKEKMRLEGQLESLSAEASQVSACLYRIALRSKGFSVFWLAGLCMSPNSLIIPAMLMLMLMLTWMLSLQALKEKTELQAQLASVNAQLQAQLEQNQVSQQTQSNLTLEVGNLRQNCSELERAMSELQGSLEAKNGSLASLSNDLQVAEEQYQRLLGKVEEMQQSISSRDNTGEELRRTALTEHTPPPGYFL